MWYGAARAIRHIQYLARLPGPSAAQICNCGLATGADQQDTCPNSVAGNIAHIRRGTTTFAAKVAYAQSKGAIGVIISDNGTGNLSARLL